MENIIIIRASDPDGSIYQKIRTALGESIEEVSVLGNTELNFQGLTIKVDEGVVLRNGNPVHLNYAEFSMLCYMAQHPGYIFTKGQLYAAVYGDNCFSSNTVPNTICRIRRKIEPDAKRPIYIKTVVGMGYKFEKPKDEIL